MDKLLVSFSGGETSAYMAQWLWKNKRNEFDMVFVFANTGQENEQTLEFVQNCSEYFGFPVHWVEAKVDMEARKGTRHSVVDFASASRNGSPFEQVIAKYGIPNKAFPHCTRETKLNPITSFTREYFGSRDYLTAIGIRVDEMDRINPRAKELRLIYPLISKQYIPMTKPKINFWWSQQPFRLELKGYEGNCKTCWKKSNAKLYKISQEHPEWFDFMLEMEEKYPRVGAEFLKENGHERVDRVFFRGNKSAKQIMEEGKSWNGNVKDDSELHDYQLDLFESESCEVWSSCGD
jgi:hypothetical protein